jgi:hypothetical protein
LSDTNDLRNAEVIVDQTVAECRELLRNNSADEAREIRQHRATKKQPRMTREQLKELLAKAGTEHTGFIILNAPWRPRS